MHDIIENETNTSDAMNAMRGVVQNHDKVMRLGRKYVSLPLLSMVVRKIYCIMNVRTNNRCSNVTIIGNETITSDVMHTMRVLYRITVK